MEVEIILHSISNILQLKDSLEPLVNRLSGIEINQLENNLNEIEKTVKKTKKNHFQGSEEHLQTWLRDVKQAIIEFNDLIEDINLKESLAENISYFRWVLSLTSYVRVSYQVRQPAKNLKSLRKRANELKFSEEEAAAGSRRRFSNKSFKEVTAIGRENEKKEIIDQLLKLNSAVVFRVFVIVGGSGIGKTKLAHLVCEDEQVKSHFGFPRIWIEYSAHESFDFESIAKSASRLIVLDDLQIENKDDLEKLQQKLMESGRTGWAILIATRSNHVANNIAGFAATRFVLQGLNEHNSRLLFQKNCQSTSTSTSTNNKQDNEWDIMKDCGGVPLAIIIKATLMNQIIGQEGEGKIAEVEREFLNELKFFYYEDLPTRYKLCFTFCSLFPDDHLIDAERLIQLWTAEGFLPFSSNSQEEHGFNEFFESVFQQNEKENSEDQCSVVGECGVTRQCYRMNQLMHKLARSVASSEIITMDSKAEIVDEGMLRASFDFGLELLSCGIPDWVFKAKKLRTILLPYKNTSNPRLPHEVKMTMSTCDKIFKAFKNSMRVLDLHDLGIKIVPTSIKEMKYLRFLDLSHNNIENLPSCITELIHLQTLKLSYCHVLKELPKDLKDLTRLSHLDIEGCLDLTHMPTGIDKLTSLQTLSIYVASKKHAFTGGLRELSGLNNLKGNLEILHLEQVEFSPSNDATKDGFLKNKQHLQNLTLKWDRDDDEEVIGVSIGVDNNDVNDDKDKNLLDCLQPHQNLRVLFVAGYNGQALSEWLNSIHFLVKFTLSDCPKCKILPPMDNLPNLKVLHLRRLKSLEFIAENCTTLEFFKSFKELTISDCPNLKSWWKNEMLPKNDRPAFPCISKLHIRCCPELACLPRCTDLDEEMVLVDSNIRSMRGTIVRAETETSSQASLLPLSNLKSMVIERIEKSPPQNWLMHFISLEELHIRDCPNLKSLPQGFKTLCSLQSLSIERCHDFDLENSEDEWNGLNNLNFLTLRSIPKLKSLTKEFGNVKSLKELRIYDCHGLTSLPENFGNFTSLEKLVISDCRSLKSLPEGMTHLKSSLKELHIRDCPLLTPRCQPDTGDDWPQIKDIINKSVRETPQDVRDF